MDKEINANLVGEGGIRTNNICIYLLWLMFREWGEKGSPGWLLWGDIGLGRLIVLGVWWAVGG